MNLHGVVFRAIGAINPNRYISYQKSMGSVPGPGGVRQPQYAAPVKLSAQVQDVSQGDLRKADGLNIQGVKRKAYFTGQAAGVVRVRNYGGDLITLDDGSLWLVAMALEDWPDWVCVMLVLQKPAGAP
jgi:hypothetical protein